jgi:hypothetical protein
MPEDYFFFLEETDWCFQIRRAGWKVVHLPEPRIVHIHGWSTKKKTPASTRIEYHRSLYHFFRKNRGWPTAAIVVALRFVKTLLHLVVMAPVALFSPRARSRWGQRAQVLAWHLKGCPRGAGLARTPPPASAPEGKIA